MSRAEMRHFLEKLGKQEPPVDLEAQMNANAEKYQGQVNFAPLAGDSEIVQTTHVEKANHPTTFQTNEEEMDFDAVTPAKVKLVKAYAP
mgnify:CR=1 FL=1